jgi:glycosyltransferase involved in cell wall biosynthesis
LGGTAVAVGQASNFLVKQGTSVTIFEFQGVHEFEPTVALDKDIKVNSYKSKLLPRLGFNLELRHDLKNIETPDLIHIHGLWRLYYAQIAHYARKGKIPLVVSTHGMLEQWALGRSKTIKWIARVLYQDKILENAACLHTTSSEEAVTIRQLGFTNPIAIIPWGIESAEISTAPCKKHKDRWGVEANKRIALFVSRLHPAKGLDVLLKAWSCVRQRLNDWVLVIAGYDSDGYQRELIRLARDLEIESDVVFLGPVHGQEKDDLFISSDLFILPSRSENFGLVVPEALSKGLPVITTTGTPWSKIAEIGCGWWIERDVQSLVYTLNEAMTKDGDELRNMGMKGRAWIQDKFSLEASGHSLLELYRWILKRGPKPSFVQYS